MAALGCSAVASAPMGAEPLPKGEQVPDSIPANPVPIEMFAGAGELGRLPGLNPTVASAWGQCCWRSQQLFEGQFYAW